LLFLLDAILSLNFWVLDIRILGFKPLIRNLGESKCSIITQCKMLYYNCNCNYHVITW